jgi:hypothetical protein
MKKQNRPSIPHTLCAMALAIAVLAGCGTPQAQNSAAPGVDASESTAEVSAQESLDETMSLALGTLQLENTAQAVSAGQAAALLPLWQAVRSGSLQSDEELGAVLAQIERQLSAEQLAEIAEMQLTNESLRAWADEQGLTMTFGAQGSGEGQRPELSPEELEQFQQQFGGQAPDPQALQAMREQFGNMTDEQLSAARATAQVSGTGLRQRSPGIGPGQAALVLEPLIGLLTSRAGE